MTPTEELRAAAARLRDDRNTTTGSVDSDSRELLEMIRLLLGVREPLIRLLEDEATLHLPDNECGWCNDARNPLKLPCPALAVARTINSTVEPGRGAAGYIEDRRSGRSLYEQLMRAAGEAL
ncbi:hypothetical protein [Streptomyces sp. Amel2xC10]|uniref:hypothetical protein n=1 Tax=Streptomyces sp. Amel2xC10 TaxID=1305826 RepID=UPI000A085AF5|nr:hypothetical protein [Streptomyces sp. Amel2xC10]SMF86688.1 hypothetical protein SAMN02745830_07204 [Streptomyces sp. Amel2xC10]